MSVIKNGIQAIECGIEDYKAGTDARLKSSIRNVHAGILLLLKEKLVRVSPAGSNDALIKQRVVPLMQKGKVIWKGSGRKTVDTQSLEERFESLQIKFNWKSFKSIGIIRNDIEHYFTTANTLAIQEALSKSFALMRNFMMNELKVDPKKKIRAELWMELIKIGDVYDAEKKACDRTIKYFDSASSRLTESLSEYACPDCGSGLVRFKPGGSSECRACGEVNTREASILALIDTVYGASDYSAVMDGAEPVVRDCPECGEDTFIAEGMICANCGETQEDTCARCSGPIPIGEIGGKMCGYCEHMTSKDD